jgi:hypothetical protein
LLPLQQPALPRPPPPPPTPAPRPDERPCCRPRLTIVRWDREPGTRRTHSTDSNRIDSRLMDIATRVLDDRVCTPEGCESGMDH